MYNYLWRNVMAVVEIGFKIKEDKTEAERLLLKNGFENIFKTANTRDIYFGKDVVFEGRDEEQIKNQLIRCRGCEMFENLKVFDKSLPDRLKVDVHALYEYFDKFFKAGFDVVFDTKKSDWIYRKGNCYHQLQEIENIGLLDYVIDNDLKELKEEEQFNILTKQMEELGFHLEYELGVDKLRSLHYKKLMFSKNQAGLYPWQK